MITVGYDSQIFDLQQRGGISRYFTELIETFDQADMGIHAQLIRSSRRRSPRGGVISRRVRSELNLRAARRAAVEVWHSTYYQSRYLSALTQRPHVITIHDMLPERFPECFQGKNPHLAKRAYILTASAIVVPSAYTAAELAYFYPRLTAPVSILPEAPGSVFDGRASGRTPIRSPYFLYVGARDAYKDFAVLLQAFAALAGNQAEIRILAVGGGDLTSAERRYIAQLGLTDRVSQLSADDQGLKDCYSNAMALVVTARAEGFGLPIVEAMACGCPVIASSGGALTEVGADAAVYFAPGNVEQLASHLRAVSEDSAARQLLANAGLERATHFSWRSTAAGLATLYTDLSSE